MRREPLQEESRQLGDVAVTFAQAWHADVEDIEAVVEVLPEVARFHRYFKIRIGGRDDPRVNRNGLVPTDTLDGTLLEEPQQVDLQVLGQIADFVEEQGAAVGRFNETNLALVSIRERAFLVTEQLRLDQRRGQCCAVDGHERAVGALGLLVYETRGQFFSGAAVAGDQHGLVFRRDLGDLAGQIAHHRAVAH